MDYQMDCPKCGSTHTFPTPETMYERFCGSCWHVWNMISDEDIEVLEFAETYRP